MKKLSMRLQPFLNRPTDLILTNLDAVISRHFTAFDDDDIIIMTTQFTNARQRKVFLSLPGPW